MRAIILRCVVAGSLFVSVSGGARSAQIPEYLVRRIEEAPPLTKGITPYPTQGPYSGTIPRVDQGESRAFAVNDTQLWFQDYDQIWKLLVPTNGRATLLRMIRQTLYLDAPGGFASWDENTLQLRQLVRPPGAHLVTDIAQFNGRMFATNGGNRIFVTDDFGSWESFGKLPSDIYELLASSDTNLYTVGKTSRQLLVVPAAGQDWSPAGRIEDSLGRLNQLVSGPDGSLWIATNTGIYRSSDQGKNWLASDRPPVKEVFSLSVRKNRLLAGTSGGLWESSRPGTWTHIDTAATRPTVTRLRVIAGQLFACTAYGLQESSDLGKTWNESDNLGEGVEVRDVGVTDDGVEYATTDSGLFQRAGKSGRWTATKLKGSFTELEILGARVLVARIASPQEHLSPTTFVSPDHGVSWKEAPIPGAHIAIHLAARENAFYAVSDAGAFRMPARDVQWSPIQTGLPTLSVHAIRSVGDGVVAVANSRIFGLSSAQVRPEWLPKTEVIAPIANLLTYAVDELPTSPPIFLAATSSGLYWRGSSTVFSIAFPPPQATLRYNVALSIVQIRDPSDARSSRLFLGTDSGVWYLKDDIPRFEGWMGPWNRLEDFHKRHSNEGWYWIVSISGGLLAAYFTAVGALIVAYWLGANVFVGRPWLLTLADKPLQVVPRLGRWAMFVGYRKRLAENVPYIVTAGKVYFGLTARMPNGELSRPDATGDILHHHLASALKDSRHVVLTGRAGAGKTTAMARTAWLCLRKEGPSSMRNYLPIFVSAPSYKGDLLKAISDTLRKRDGVPVDESGQSVRAQLSTGNILILVDGYSEVEGDRSKALQEMIETASNPEFQGCRFIFAGRPLDFFPEKALVFELQPLDIDTIQNVYLPCLELDHTRQQRVLQQLIAFGNKPIDPLLLTMAVADGISGETSQTRSDLFIRYFRRLLKVDLPQQGVAWEGWKFCLEQIADWFLLSTGKRGIGMAHRELIDAIAGKTSTPADPLFVQLKRYYRLSLKDELDVLETLQSASILKRESTWRFAHDAYEEVFAASRLNSLIETGAVPALTDWLVHAGELAEVLFYLAEMGSKKVQATILQSSWPEEWKLQACDDSNRPEVAGVEPIE